MLTFDSMSIHHACVGHALNLRLKKGVGTYVAGRDMGPRRMEGCYISTNGPPRAAPAELCDAGGGRAAPAELCDAGGGRARSASMYAGAPPRADCAPPRADCAAPKAECGTRRAEGEARGGV